MMRRKILIMKVVLVMFGSEGGKVVGDDEKEDLDNEGGPCHVW